MNHQVYTENLFWNKKNSVKCFLHLNSKMKDLETAEMLQEWILQALLTQIVILYDYAYDIMVRFGFRWFPLLWDFLIPKLKDPTLPWKDKRENITHCYQDCHWCLLRQNLSYVVCIVQGSNDKGYLLVKVGKDVHLKGMLLVKLVSIRHLDSLTGMERWGVFNENVPERKRVHTF